MGSSKEMDKHSLIVWYPNPPDAITCVQQCVNIASPLFVANFQFASGTESPYQNTTENIAELMVSAKSTDNSLGCNFALGEGRRSGGRFMRFSIGISNPAFPNTLSLSLSKAELLNAGMSRVLGVFTSLCEKTNAFWGAIESNLNAMRIYEYGESIDRMKVPDTIHWLNFYGSDFVERIGRKRIKNAPFHKVAELDNGSIVAVLKETPLDDNSPGDRGKQTEVGDYLNLAKLHKKYGR